MRTATSSKQIAWVEESAKQLEEAKGQGQVTDEEYAEFESIIRLAARRQLERGRSRDHSAR